MDLGLKGKVAFVAGASQGLGKAVAMELCREGAKVAICGLDDPELPKAVEEIAAATGGEVIGIIPRFMTEVEWQHPGVANLEVVEDMRERKHKLLTGSDAVIALPGGSGTLEELFEAITLKRLGIYFNPIVLLNIRDFYTPLQTFMRQTIEQRFMNAEHLDMWSLVDTVAEALPRIRATPRWREDARAHAAVKA